MKNKIVIGSLLVCILMLMIPTISAIPNNNQLTPPVVKPLGAFQIIIYPLTEPIKLYEIIEITGTHQQIPGVIDTFFPGLLAWQYSHLEVTKCPDWAVITIPNKYIFTKPDGQVHNFSLFITLNDNAPMNTAATLGISITTGKYMRTIFPPWFPFCQEFNLDQELLIRTGEW